MNLNFSQSTGFVTKDDGTFVAKGWSGNDYRPKENPTRIQGRNNPAMQDKHCVGPLPRDMYRVGPWEPHAELGQLSASLTSMGVGESFGRDGFYIHGPGGDDPANCSMGCIVIPHDARVAVAALNPTTITVTT
jgi:hypothetical protein